VTLEHNQWWLNLLGVDTSNIPQKALFQIEWTWLPQSWQWFVLLGILALGAWGIFWLYRREIDTCPTWAKIALGGLRTFALIHFSGYLFFVISPVELLFINMPVLSSMKWDMIGIAVGTGLLAQTIDYGIGETFSNFVIQRIIGERRYNRYLGRIKRYGDATIFLFCFLPLSSPVAVLVAGMIQYGFLRVFFFCTLGLTAKYILLAHLFGCLRWKKPCTGTGTSMHCIFQRLEFPHGRHCRKTGSMVTGTFSGKRL